MKTTKLANRALHIKRTLGPWYAARFLMTRGCSVELCHALIWRA